MQIAPRSRIYLQAIPSSQLATLLFSFATLQLVAGKDVNVVAQGLREVYASGRDSFKERKELEKQHGLAELFWANMPVEDAQDAIGSKELGLMR